MKEQAETGERSFLILILILMVAAGVLFKNAQIAMWFGFILAGYSVIANDSIQTIGTFLASNQMRKWQILWLYLGGIFAVTAWYSWTHYGGDVSYGRLAAKGLEKAPEKFDYLQLAAPIFLLIVTYLKMPVSTTFLILSSFATKASTIGKILFKSLSGYFLAFFASLVSWPLIKKWIDRYGKEEAGRGWVVAQWITSGLLWAVWLMQDAANIAVYLPRQLSITQFAAFVIIIVGGLGVLSYFKGGRIQSIVTRKAFVNDVRHATIIDAIYAVILYCFKIKSKIPMSTTWVFLGNLGGRELAFAMTGDREYKKTKRMIFRDISYAAIGLIISLFISIGVNEQFRMAFFAW